MKFWFNIRPNDVPRLCRSKTCNEEFTLEHADSCSKGGNIIKRHDAIKTIIARHCERAFGMGSTRIEPMLGSLDNASKVILSGNIDDNARADILFQDQFSSTYLDVCVISPVCDSKKSEKIATGIEKAERKKNLDYKERINKVLGAEFLPIILTSGGCMSNTTKALIQMLGDKIAWKQNTDPKDDKRRIRTDISMALIKSRVKGLRINKDGGSSRSRHITSCQFD